MNELALADLGQWSLELLVSMFVFNDTGILGGTFASEMLSHQTNLNLSLVSLVYFDARCDCKVPVATGSPVCEVCEGE